MWLSEKINIRSVRCFFITISFLLVFFPSAIRYDIGTDYHNYLRIFESGTYREYQFKEPAFYFINWSLDSVNGHFQWLFFICAFIFTIVIFKAYSRKNAFLLHFLFFSMLWFPSFNIIRQSIALSWCLLALLYFFDKRYICFFILTFIGSLFHQSALVVMLIGGLSLIPLPIKFKTHIAPMIFILILGVMFLYMNNVFSYMEKFLNAIGMETYANYFHSDRHFVTRDFGSGLGAMMKALFSIYVILNAKQYIQENNKFWLLIVLVFFYALGTVLASKIVIFGRMADIFIVGQILAAYYLWSLPRNRVINRVIVFIFILFLTASFLKVSFGTPTSYANPKLNPFQTIFSRDL